MSTPRPPSAKRGGAPSSTCFRGDGGDQKSHRCVPCEYKIHAGGEAAQEQFLAACAGLSPRQTQSWNQTIRKPGEVIEEHDPHGLWAATTDMRDIYFRRLRVQQHQTEEAQRIARALVRREDVRAKLAERKAKREALQRDAGALLRFEPAVRAADTSRSEYIHVVSPVLFASSAATPSTTRPASATTARQLAAQPGPSAVVEVSAPAAVRGPCSWVSLESERPRSILGHIKRFRQLPEERSYAVMTSIESPRCETSQLPTVTSNASRRPSSAKTPR